MGYWKVIATEHELKNQTNGPEKSHTLGIGWRVAAVSHNWISGWLSCLEYQHYVNKSKVTVATTLEVFCFKCCKRMLLHVTPWKSKLTAKFHIVTPDKLTVKTHIRKEPDRHLERIIDLASQPKMTTKFYFMETAASSHLGRQIMTMCSDNCLLANLPNFAKGEWPKTHQGTWHPQYSPSSKFAGTLNIPPRVGLLAPSIFHLE